MKANSTRQDFVRTIIRGILAGGLATGIVGGLWVAVNCYLGHLDPDIYPNRSVFTLCFMFAVGFVFAVVPGIVLGTIGSLVVFYLPRRKPSAPDSIDTPEQDTWPPAPMITRGDSNDSGT